MSATSGTRPDLTAASSRSKAVRVFVALLVVGIWIPLLCTAPQILGNVLWRKFGFASDLPLAQLARVTLNSIAVILFILATRRARLFVPERPRRPAVFLLFIPLMAVNILRGPFTDAGFAFVLVSLASAMLTGFWEEFLFRGLVQERLSILGTRLCPLVTAILFSLIHSNEGPIAVLIALAIGLAFCVARDSLGLWPLVLIHGTIDFASATFRRQWGSFNDVGYTLVAIYGLVALAVLLWPRPSGGAGRGTEPDPV